MSLYNLPNATSGIDAIVVVTATAVPSFIPMFLLFIFMVVLISGTTAQKRRTGSSDFALWTTLASVSTFLVTLPLTLIIGVIPTEIFAVVVVITLMSGVWLFLDKNRFEV